MLDPRLFLKDDTVLTRLRSRGIDAATGESLTRLVETRRSTIQKVEALRAQLNIASAAVQEKARAGDQKAVDAARGELKDLKARIKEGEEELGKAESALE